MHSDYQYNIKWNLPELSTESKIIICGHNFLVCYLPEKKISDVRKMAAMSRFRPAIRQFAKIMNEVSVMENDNFLLLVSSYLIIYQISDEKVI